LLSRLDPPFRAEHVGSLLRPKALLDLRARFGRGEIDRETLSAAEDRAIRDARACRRSLHPRCASRPSRSA
jgi:methionine synthase II (cobalamin-independent)